MCTLDVSTFNYANLVVLNTAIMLDQMAGMIEDAGVKIEIEVFDTGQLWQASDMCARGPIRDTRPLFQLCLGITWGARPSMETMRQMRDDLPDNALWASFGISRFEFPMATAAIVLGGHVRVGLEDNLYISKGVLASGNAVLVEQAVRLIEATGEWVASPTEARETLGL
jgi:uncharacterized protein (DUF849 family)